MTENTTTLKTASFINSRVLVFATKRETAFKIVQESGRTSIPDLDKKLHAIATIRKAFFRVKGKAFVDQITAMEEVKDLIRFILPSPYSRFQRQRKEMLDLIHYCVNHHLNQVPS